MRLLAAFPIIGFHMDFVSFISIGNVICIHRNYVFFHIFINSRLGKYSWKKVVC